MEEKVPHLVITNAGTFLISFVLMFIFFGSVSLYGAVQYGVMKEKIEWVEENILIQMENTNERQIIQETKG